MQKMSHKEIAKKMAVLPISYCSRIFNGKELVSYGRFPYQKPLSSLTKEDHEIISGNGKNGSL